MFSEHLSEILSDTRDKILSQVLPEEIDTEIGRKKIDKIIGERESPYYYAIVNPLRFKINYFCNGGLSYLGLSNLNYQGANFGLLTKILAKENMGMVYQGVQHFMSTNRNTPLEFTFKVKRFDNTWRNIFFVTKLLRYENETKGLTTISIIIDIEDYLNNQFKKNSKQKTTSLNLNTNQLNIIKTLSIRELEVLALLGSETSIEQIAEQLHISVHTVRAHKRSILKKLNSKSPLTLAKYALFAQTNPDLFN